MQQDEASGDGLRWVCYDGIYYAALFVAQQEAPQKVPPGHQFVFFLDGECGAVVPDSDVEPYDPNDTEKASHPAAKAGVELANLIIHGSAGSQVENSSSVPLGHTNGGSGGHTLNVVAMLDDEDSEDGLQGKSFLEEYTHQKQRLADKHTDDGGREDSRKPKNKEKTDKKGKKKHTALHDAGEPEVEAKRRHKKHGSLDFLQEKDGDETPPFTDGDQGGESRVEKKQTRSLKNEDEAAANHWSTFAEDFGSEEGETDDNDSQNQHEPETYRQRRIGSAAKSSAARTGFRMKGLMNGAGGSLVAQYLTQIHYHYERVREEATACGKLLSLHVSDVVRLVHTKLTDLQAKTAFLEQQLRQAEAEGSATENDLDALRGAIQDIRGSFNVESFVRGVVVMQENIYAEGRPRPKHVWHRKVGFFQDPSIALILENFSSTARPREVTLEIATKYCEQRLHRDRVLNYAQGLGKAGLFSTAPGAYMENWYREHELMVLAAAVENQPVMPHGYVARRYAEAMSTVEKHAFKRLFRGSGQTQSERENAGGAAYGNGPEVEGLSQQQRGGSSSLFMTYGSYRSQEDLLAVFNNNTRPNKQGIPVYYNFHDLKAHSGAHAHAPSDLLASLAGPGASPYGLRDALLNLPPAAAPASSSGDGMPPVDGGGPDGLTSHVPVISPLHLDFDHRALFGDAGEPPLPSAAWLPSKSREPSLSMGLPSEGYWASEGDHDDDPQPSYGGSREGWGRARSSSRAPSEAPYNGEPSSRPYRVEPSRKRGFASRARSIGSASEHTEGGAKDDLDDADAPRRRRFTTRHRTAQEGGEGRAMDWRASAKRAIQERLTLYYRGLRGYPAVLSKEDLQTVGKRILERAVLAESERRGVSMTLQVNNTTVPFTKELEIRLKRSVDNYVQRHFIQHKSNLSVDSKAASDLGSLRRQERRPQERSRGGKEEDLPEPDNKSEVVRRPRSVSMAGAEDSPIYQP